VATAHHGLCPYCERMTMIVNIGDYNWPDRVVRGMRD
jgi:hypothetical protein